MRPLLLLACVAWAADLVTFRIMVGMHGIEAEMNAFARLLYAAGPAPELAKVASGALVVGAVEACRGVRPRMALAVAVMMLVMGSIGAVANTVATWAVP